MPDGDKIHTGLSQRYQKVYQQVCEGYLSDEDLSYEVSQPLVKDIQQYDDVPIKFIEQVAIQLEQMPTGPLFNDADFWKQMSQEIDKIAQRQAYGYNRRGLDLAVEGSKEILLDLRSGKYPHNFRQAMIHNYVRKVYSANFEERIPLSKQHYNNVSQATLDEKLESVRPHIERRIAMLSRQIARKSSVNSLNPPEQMKVQLLQLCERYVREWESVQHLVGRELLDCEKNGQLSNVATIYQQEQMVWI